MGDIVRVVWADTVGVVWADTVGVVWVDIGYCGLSQPALSV